MKISTLITFFLLLCVMPALSACNLGYIARSTYEEALILLRRQPISEIIASPENDEYEDQKLQAVLDARQFADQIGLNVGASFSTYSQFDYPVASWVVMASHKDSFNLYSWWFPIIGTLPYQGFFERADADELAKSLELQGYETWTRDADAFSTLGWFDDPLLTTTLRQDIVQLVNTVIHESVHRTIWVPNDVSFNESLANFVGRQAAVEFYYQQFAKCPQIRSECSTKARRRLDYAKLLLQLDIDASAALTKLHTNLEALYQSNLTRQEKIDRRVNIFEQDLISFKEKWPQASILTSVNNAELMQLKIYLTGTKAFADLYQCSGFSWTRFFQHIELLSKDSNNTEGDALNKVNQMLAKAVDDPQLCTKEVILRHT